MSFQANLAQAALANTYFRKVLFTTPLTQVVVMHINPGEDIGLETHHLDQVLVFVSGTAETILDAHRGVVSAGDVVVVPAGTEHNFITLGDEPLKLYTIYAPPEHAPGTIHKTKAEAEAAEAAEHGHGGAAAAPGRAPGTPAVPPMAQIAMKASPALGKLTVGSLVGKAQI
jgi:mannose-6-phosphate isomerase-like protein (cupin superfamily)